MNVGIVSTRLAGLDGVSLEAAKWTAVLRRMGHQVFYCAGQLEADGPPGALVEEMHFLSRTNLYVHKRAFKLGTDRLDRLDIHHRIETSAAHLRGHLEAFVQFYDINVLIAENAQAIPVNVPLGVALADLVRKKKFPTIGHHHDFFWERRHFRKNRIDQFLCDYFPPGLPTEVHVVINTIMKRVLRERKGISAHYIPNVFDFATPPPGVDDYNADFRQELDLAEDDVLILQPTRIVRRKAIEHSVELVRCLRDPRYKLILTGSAGDEGHNYERRLRARIEEAGIDARFIRDRLGPKRCERDGFKCYSLWDAYIHADFVTYPSEYEGFGNALVETLYFRKPFLVNRYPVYIADIAPTGVQAVEISRAVTDGTARQVRELLEDPARRQEMVEHNYEIGRKHFSYELLEESLHHLLLHLEDV